MRLTATAAFAILCLFSGPAFADYAILLKSIPALPMKSGTRQLPGGLLTLKQGNRGQVMLGDESSPFLIRLDFHTRRGVLTLEANTEPWAIVYVDGVSHGKVPVLDLAIDDSLRKLEFKRPGVEDSITLFLKATRR